MSSAQTLITPNQLGQLLKSARRRRGLTQTAVAERLGLSQNRVSYLELHPDNISFEQLLAWCAAVGLQLQIGERPAPSRSEKASREGEW